MDCSLPDFSVHGILQKWTLECVAISFSRGSSQPRNWTQGFPGGSEGKASAYNVGDRVQSVGREDSPGEGNGNPLQYCCLENPMDWEWGHKESDTTGRLHFHLLQPALPLASKDQSSEFLPNSLISPVSLQILHSESILWMLKPKPRPFSHYTLKCVLIYINLTEMKALALSCTEVKA